MRNKNNNKKSLVALPAKKMKRRIKNEVITSYEWRMTNGVYVLRVFFKMRSIFSSRLLFCEEI
jgi:hypothetical protein